MTQRVLVLVSTVLTGACYFDRQLTPNDADEGASGSSSAADPDPDASASASATGASGADSTSGAAQGDSSGAGDASESGAPSLGCQDWVPTGIGCEPHGEAVGMISPIPATHAAVEDTPCTVAAIEAHDENTDFVHLDCSPLDQRSYEVRTIPHVGLPLSVGDALRLTDHGAARGGIEMRFDGGELALAEFGGQTESHFDIGPIAIDLLPSGCPGEQDLAHCDTPGGYLAQRSLVSLAGGQAQLFDGDHATVEAGPTYSVLVNFAIAPGCVEEACTSDAFPPFAFGGVVVLLSAG